MRSKSILQTTRYTNLHNCFPIEIIYTCILISVIPILFFPLKKKKKKKKRISTPLDDIDITTIITYVYKRNKASD